MTPEQRAALGAAESALVAGTASLTALSEAVRVLRASLTEGVEQISRALPGDRTIRWADWLRMNSAWRDNGLQMLHGRGGFGFLGLPLPWGSSADVDAYLTAHGHARG